MRKLSPRIRGWLTLAFLLLAFGLVGHLEYQDCIRYGVC